MAETAAKKAAAPSPITVNIPGAPIPLNTDCALSGSIEFTCLPNPTTYVWTWNNSGVPAPIFAGQTNNYVTCAHGPNGPFTFNSSVSLNDTLTFQANSLTPSEHVPPHVPPALSGGKGTIKITSMVGADEK